MMLSILLMVLDHRFKQTETLRSALSTLTYPIQFLAETPSAIGNWIIDSWQMRSDLQERNALLTRENLKLHAELQQVAALQAENERLRDLLGSAYKIGNRVLVAELSAMDLDPFRQQVMINKGSTSGVFEGQAVLELLRNGLRTIAVGTGRINELELPYLPNNADVRKGDLLVTSGLGGKFPPGYPVARIIRVERIPGKPFAHVTAEPLAQLDRTREVLLVWEVKPPELIPDRPTQPPPPPAPPTEAEAP